MRIVIAIILLGASLLATAQKNTLRTTFVFPKKIVRDSIDLAFKIVFTNLLDKPALVYSTLVYSNSDDDSNLYLDIQKKEGVKYNYYPIIYSHKMNQSESDTTCRDLPKKELLKGKSDTLSFSLMQVSKYFKSGEYRVKIYLRDKCKIIMPKGEGDIRHVEMDFVKSEWLYFKVINPIFQEN